MYNSNQRPDLAKQTCRIRRRHSATVCGLIVAVLLFGACGGDDDDESSDVTTRGTAGTQREAESDFLDDETDAEAQSGLCQWKIAVGSGKCSCDGKTLPATRTNHS